MKISIAMLAHNEAANLPRVLPSVAWADEIILVDSGSTDETVAIAQQFGAKVFYEPWKGYGPQMNSSIDKCSSPWIFSMDADEEMSPELAAEIRALIAAEAAGTKPEFNAYWVPRRNQIFGRWMRYGGLYPDLKLRLFRPGTARLEENLDYHAALKWPGPKGRLKGDLLHYQYPTIELYLEHMNRYSTASTPVLLRKGKTCSGLAKFLSMAVANPILTFLKNYGLRGGFLDGREGLIFHLYHSGYVSWKYAKVWEASRKSKAQSN